MNNASSKTFENVKNIPKLFDYAESQFTETVNPDAENDNENLDNQSLQHNVKKSKSLKRKGSKVSLNSLKITSNDHTKPSYDLNKKRVQSQKRF